MKKNYFLVVSILLLILSLLAFSDNLFTDVGQKSNSDPKFIIHGLFCFAWFIILVVQSRFIHQRNVKAHIRWGIAGMAAAAGVFLTTVFIFWAIYKGWDQMGAHVKANRFFMAAFALLIVLAWLKRKRPALHKRFILVASFYMLGPILDRAMAHSILDNLLVSDLSWDIVFLSIWTSFFVSLFIYDQVLLKRVHRISLWGFLFFAVVWVVAMI